MSLPPPKDSDLNGLLPLLQRLDYRLESAISAVRNSEGIAPLQTTDETNIASDPYRGMHIDDAEVDQLLSQTPGAPQFLTEEELVPPWKTPGSRLAHLQHSFELSDFDIEVIAIALAPELDRRYERLYAYLQDDVRCKRPTIDLALNLLCLSAADRLKQRVHFAPDAPLIHHHLLYLGNDAAVSYPTLLERQLVLDDQVIRFLLNQSGLDAQLTSSCKFQSSMPCAPQKQLDVEEQRSLIQFIQQAWQATQSLRLYFEGNNHAGKHEVIQALNLPILIADLAAIAAVKETSEPLLKRVFREAWFQNAVLYLENVDTIQGKPLYSNLLKRLAEHPKVTLLSGEQMWIPGTMQPLGLVSIPFPIPNFAQRRTYWKAALSQTTLTLHQDALDALANRFRLTSDQIEDAIATVIHQAQWQGIREPANISQPTLTDWFEAARAQSGHQLRTLAPKVQLRYCWHDLVLPSDSMSLLKELCNQAKYRYRVYEDWGFGQKLSQGKGLNALFCGLPGTGKTMAAEVIAQTLQLDLYRIDLSQVVSKYIGETEKNLDRIFTAAANSNAILLFDEADALFGKRSEVQDAHDRYANIEIGYLLQKMEAYEGLAILTTNSRSSLDDAFVRRLQFIIEFPLPDAAERSQIWRQVFPDQLPQSSDLEFEDLAQRHELTGASIRNIALAAAFLAAADQNGTMMTMQHITQAVQREYQKMGKFLLPRNSS